MWPLPITICLQIVQETPLEVVYFEKTKRGLFTKMEISFEVDMDDILFAMPAPTVITKGTRTYYGFWFVMSCLYSQDATVLFRSLIGDIGEIKS